MNERDKTAHMMQDSAGWNWGTEKHFQRFAELTRADERNACAEIDFYELLRTVCGKEQAEEYANLISTAIKARSNK